MSTTILERTDLAHSFSPARSLPLLLTSDPVMTGASRLFAGPGLTRIAPGTYVPSQEWAEARPDLRHMTLIRAAMAKTRGDVVLLGPSAAVWLGLPLVGRLPGRVQCPASVRPGRARRCFNAIAAPVWATCSTHPAPIPRPSPTRSLTWPGGAGSPRVSAPWTPPWPPTCAPAPS